MGITLTPNKDDNEVTRPHGDALREHYQKSQEDDESPAVQMDRLASHISQVWSENKDDRVRIEQQMMRLQEAVNGEYDPNTIKAIRGQGGSDIYIPLTSMQCNAGASWLLSVLNPPGDKAFSFKSTPVPDLPAHLREKIETKVKSSISQNAPKDEETGLPTGPDGEVATPDLVKDITDMEVAKTKKAFNKESAKRAERMEQKVSDQLEQSGWFPTLEDFITDLVTFPTAFIKTTYETQVSMSVTTVDGKITMERNEELVAKDTRVSPFDVYPSPEQTSVHNGSMIERLKLSRSEVYNCVGKPGYSDENIFKVLQELDSRGFADWQSNVDSTRRYSENHSTDFSGQDGSLYGLRFLGPVSVDKMLDWGYSVDVLQSQGYITSDLDEHGMPAPIDRYREIDIDAILIGNHVIKAVPNMDVEGKRPYYAASYRKVPGSFWGKSVAMLVQPHARLVNASARALSNNMGIASGPQILAYVDRIPEGESIQALTPLKIWQVVSDPQGGSAKPIDFWQPDSNAKELMAVYQYYFDSAGEVTGIPRTSYATDPTRTMPGAQTASGLAMLLETASKQIKQAVRNIDTGVIEPRLQYQYRTNMMDPDVPNYYKGDMRIVAIGAKSIVAKAVENQRSVELLQATANPLDAQLLGESGRAAIYRSIGRNYDIPGLVPSEEELEERAAQQQEQAQQPPPSPEELKLEIEKLRSQTRIEDQKLESELAKQQQETDLQIAKMELERKKIDAEIAVVQNKENNQAKLQQVAIKEKNANTRFQSEINLKAQTGEGI